MGPTQRRATLPGSGGATSMELEGSRHVVSTRIPARATMRRTMVAKIAIAVRVNPSGFATATAALGVEVSADTVISGV
jgi:hypothetical protein